VAKLLAPWAADRVAAYASWLRLDVAGKKSTDHVARVGDDGWRFTKWGLRRVPGSTSAAEADRLVAAVDHVVHTLGQAAAFDALFTWDVGLARRFARDVDVSIIRWLEDPLVGWAAPGYHELGERLPLALGERLLAVDNPAPILAINPAAFTVDVIGCGGLTRAVELIAAAHSAGIPTYAHGRSFIPALHLAAAFPHAVPAVEYQVQWMPRRQRLYAHRWVPQRGYIQLPDVPGLGATPRS
jgi:L-alanine-DL-glutamate epimerase-like enolase superfamily enzyme